MTDLKINGQRLVIKDGDFVLTDRTDEIKQHIIVALNTFYGDWLLDYTKGIDYTRDLRQLEFLDNDCKNQIRGVDGVTNIINYTRNFDKTNLTVNIVAGIQTIYGRIDIAQTLTGA